MNTQMEEMASIRIGYCQGQELLREEMSVLNIEGGRDTQDEMLEKEDEYSEESEEETSRVFLIPKDMQILPRPLK